MAKVRRAASALPFIGIAACCLGAMDTLKLIAQQQPFLEAGHITWDGGLKSMPIFDSFYRVAALDEMWRGITVTFSAAYLPMDPVGSWQLFSFLHDLGPMYSVWLLESCRVSNTWTPIYAATFFTFVAQLLGIGNIAPIYYFLHITFAPSALSLKRYAKERRLQTDQTMYLLPLFLGLHTFEVWRAFTAPEAETRQYWVWAWQMSPMWIGLANTILSSVTAGLAGLKSSALASPRLLIAVMCGISTSIWLHTLYSAPFPLSDIFIPDSQIHIDFIRHTRKAMQWDQLSSFGSSFLWLIYLFFDLYSAELVGMDYLLGAALLPLVAIVIGPASAFVIGWYWREQILSSAKTA
ncbi:hypothetical protein PFICI_04871 [Pestalotiopsis fici W106-1]|uniref:Uncharacterized protein n=1 Tax=Pestalotiopsis fici (strain W106-1 / CGMCC3.15140) TaxID=1229662 RepID=W3XAB1_PESFW|nr:uncharacterized protein PFICI_04871 [Pestalotiopsis fici W106-1]ETS82995.1 hypothetical protein PFICI_04871 [Pestalotiopsis fici W106-1]